MQSHAKNTEPQAQGATASGSAGGAWPHRAAVGALVVLLGALYLTTLQPGVDRGDAAELQYMCPLLGICHPPGYATEVLCGKVFSLLPLGPNMAWRINLMMVICGVAGCLALYGAIRQITGRLAGALIGAATLGFSGIYWTHCLVAEAYVFYGMFLLLGVYAAARFVGHGRTIWLYLAALTLGTCIAGRPSELSILPGFLGVWLGFRRRLWLNAVRLAGALAIFLLPFVFSVGYFLLRENPAYLHARDDALRRRILASAPPALRRSGLQRLRYAVYYTLGLKWTRIGVPTLDAGPSVAARYAGLLGGLAVLTKPGAPKTAAERELGIGTSVGALGMILAAAGILFYWRQYGWVLLGLGLFVGNLLFILWHPQEDALTFTVPGLAGLAFLAGLGASGPPNATRRGRWKQIGLTLGILAPLFLLAANYRVVDRSTAEERARQEYYQHVAGAPLPRDSVIVTEYWSATTLRYLLHVEAGRTDVRIMRVRTANWQQVAEYFCDEGAPTFIPPNLSRTLSPGEQRAMRRQTPPSISELGLLRLCPPRLRGDRKP